MANKNPEAGLRDLRLPELLPDVRLRRDDMEALGAEERARFEALVERAAGKEPGEIFERRRQATRMRCGRGSWPLRWRRGRGGGLAATFRARSSCRPGCTQDMLASSATHVGLTVDDLAVFTFLSLAFETRKLPAWAAKNSARFEGRDGNVLQVRRGMNPFGHCNIADADDELMSGTRYAKSLKRLHEWKWLAVQEAAPGGDGWVRIGRGAKLRAVPRRP